MGYDPKRQKVHCFACQADYDLFDLLMLDNNLSSPGEALTLAREKWGRREAPLSTSASSHRHQPEESARITSNTAYIEACAATAEKTDYFTLLG